jgi:hypothetical protein
MVDAWVLNPSAPFKKRSRAEEPSPDFARFTPEPTDSRASEALPRTPVRDSGDNGSSHLLVDDDTLKAKVNNTIVRASLAPRLYIS